MLGQRQQPSRPLVLVAAPFLASGAALLVYILSGVSLRWTLLALAGAAVAVLVLASRWMAPERRRRLRRRSGVGAVAGVAATIAYDGVRIGLVEFAGLRIDPIEAWRLFGLALLGDAAPATLVMTVGTLFHLTNGVGFAIAYTVAFGTRGIAAGVIWAFVLEGFMVSVYPGWLGLKALEEFLSVSILGHVAYGVVLGYLARHLLRHPRWGEHDHHPATSIPDLTGEGG
jgi:hypothetical protein